MSCHVWEKQPVVISDSKGNYLKQQCSSEIENTVVWKCKSFQTSTLGLELLSKEIDDLIQEYIWLHIWLGTCDLTTLSTTGRHRYLTLNESAESDSTQTVCNFESTAELAWAKHIKVTFIEVPIISIKIARKHGIAPRMILTCKTKTFRYY